MRKGLILALLVLGGPVQAQLAHICDVMEQAVETCCCGHEKQPVERFAESCPEGVADPCCRTVVSVVDEATAAAIRPAEKPVVSAHDPPAFAPAADSAVSPSESRPTLSVARSRLDPSGYGTRTFLRTLRLRL